MGLSQFPITTSALRLHSKKTVFQRMTDVHAKLLLQILRGVGLSPHPPGANEVSSGCARNGIKQS